MLTVNDGLGFASRMPVLSPRIPTMRFWVVGLYQESIVPRLPTASDGLVPLPVPDVVTRLKVSGAGSQLDALVLVVPRDVDRLIVGRDRRPGRRVAGQRRIGVRRGSGLNGGPGPAGQRRHVHGAAPRVVRRVRLASRGRGREALARHTGLHVGHDPLPRRERCGLDRPCRRIREQDPRDAAGHDDGGRAGTGTAVARARLRDRLDLPRIAVLRRHPDVDAGAHIDGERDPRAAVPVERDARAGRPDRLPSASRRRRRPVPPSRYRRASSSRSRRCRPSSRPR